MTGCQGAVLLTNAAVAATCDGRQTLPSDCIFFRPERRGLVSAVGVLSERTPSPWRHSQQLTISVGVRFPLVMLATAPSLCHDLYGLR